MAEAKKRNKNMVFYGLPWAWPSWVGGGSSSPWKNLSLPVHYIVDWVRGAKEKHDIDIDWIGEDCTSHQLGVTYAQKDAC